jgi:zinc dependent phospholipase C
MKSIKYTLILFSLFHFTAHAFRPIGHVILKDRIVAALPDGNKFKEAMKAHPHIAAWGSVAPDLGYNLDLSRKFQPGFKRQIKNSMQLSELAHYHAVGDFITNLIREAEDRNDPEFYAFVGGWLTHIAGDFGSHGDYVKEEAGYYIAYEGGRDIHGELEKLSDAVLYRDYAKDYGLSGYDFNATDYWKVFFGISVYPESRGERKQNVAALEEMIGGSVQASFLKVYCETYGLENSDINLVQLAKNYYRAIGKGLGAYAGFKQYGMLEAGEQALLKEREKRINAAFAKGLDLGHKYLVKASSKGTVFSDNRWNLDIGEEGEPTYILRIDPGETLSSRSKNDIYITFRDKKGRESHAFKITSKFGPFNLTFYQKDPYYYAVNLGGAMGELKCWKPEDVESATLTIHRRKWQIFKNHFGIKRAVLYYNAKEIAKQESLNNTETLLLTEDKPMVLKLWQ